MPTGLQAIFATSQDAFALLKLRCAYLINLRQYILQGPPKEVVITGVAHVEKAMAPQCPTMVSTSLETPDLCSKLAHHAPSQASRRAQTL